MPLCVRSLALVSLAALGTDILGAQEATRRQRLELLAGPAYWHANRANWGVLIGAGLRLPGEFNQLGLTALAFAGQARADSASPAVTSLEFELALAIAPITRRSRPNLFLSFGLTRTHFDARLQQEALADCTPANLCLAEHVIEYDTATRWMWMPGIGAEVPLTSSFALRPHARLLIPTEQTNGGPQNVARLDVAFQWRR